MPTRLSAIEPPIHPIHLRLAIAPRPQPDVAPVTLTWTNSILVAAVHPGIRGDEIGESVIDEDVAPDWVIETWLAGYGIHAPAARIRTQWRALLGPMTDIPAYTPNIPPTLRA